MMEIQLNKEFNNFDIEELIFKCVQEDLSNIKFTIVDQSEKGDGYLSSILFTNVEGTSKSGEKEQMHLAVKCAKGIEEAGLAVDPAFQKEIFFYKTILNEFNTLQTEKLRKNSFSSVPYFYNNFVINGKQVIVLENLKMNGYKLHSRFNSMDLEHVSLVLKEYGKFHALSFALRHFKPEVFEKIADNKIDVFKNYIIKPEMIESNKKLLKRTCKILLKYGRCDIVEKLNELENKIKFIMTDLINAEEPKSVCLHGDCWNNNFMFLYKNFIPEKVSIIDWQFSKIGSPVFDVAYFLYACSSPKDLNNLDYNLLKIYYASFSDFLKLLGCDPDELFSYACFLEHWKKYSLLALIFAPYTLQFTMIDKVLDLTAGYDTMISNLNVRNEELYNERVIAVMNHYVKFTMLL